LSWRDTTKVLAIRTSNRGPCLEKKKARDANGHYKEKRRLIQNKMSAMKIQTLTPKEKGATLRSKYNHHCGKERGSIVGGDAHKTPG